VKALLPGAEREGDLNIEHYALVKTFVGKGKLKNKRNKNERKVLTKRQLLLQTSQCGI
jgi:hypothetical protein